MVRSSCLLFVYAIGIIDSLSFMHSKKVDNFAGGRHRHAFIGLGFRERTQAYDFQAALHDHMK